jgi:hypothetical protein
VDAGLSSSDTVRAATSAPANYLSAADSLGTIAVGLYREISRTIADEIGAVLSAQADARLTERPTVDPQAYEAVLKGQFHYRRSTPEDFTMPCNISSQRWRSIRCTRLRTSGSRRSGPDEREV